MAGVNKVILVGNVGRDPELRHTANGQPVANFRLATNESWTNKSGEREERTEWHTIVAWGKLAEQAHDYLSKGRQVYVEGKLQTREWEDKEGQKRRTTEVIAQQLVFLGRREGGASPEYAAGGSGSANAPDLGASSSSDDDIPF